MWAFAVVLSLAAAAIAGLLVPPLLRVRRRQRIRSPDNDLLRARLSRTRAWKRLPPDLRPRLEERVRIFLGEREFLGCGGLHVTQPMRVTVAADACLLLLGQNRHIYDDLREILLYPDEFIVPQLWEENGIVTEESRPLSGQSWDTSRIILSWQDVCDAGPGYNVVLHEFAHYHDQSMGISGGEADANWTSIATAAFAILEHAANAEIPCVLDPYSLESPAELFAVATEAFIEEPEALREDFPDIYNELQRIYEIDPLSW